MKKGFTLIELLAVIVILAIIALIATPIVINIIDSTRKSAEMESARALVNVVNNYISSRYLKGNKITEEEIYIVKDDKEYRLDKNGKATEINEFEHKGKLCDYCIIKINEDKKISILYEGSKQDIRKEYDSSELISTEIDTNRDVVSGYNELVLFKDIYISNNEVTDIAYLKSKDGKLYEINSSGEEVEFAQLYNYSLPGRVKILNSDDYTITFNTSELVYQFNNNGEVVVKEEINGEYSDDILNIYQEVMMSAERYISTATINDEVYFEFNNGVINKVDKFGNTTNDSNMTINSNLKGSGELRINPLKQVSVVIYDTHEDVKTDYGSNKLYSEKLKYSRDGVTLVKNLSRLELLAEQYNSNKTTSDWLVFYYIRRLKYNSTMYDVVTGSDDNFVTYVSTNAPNLKTYFTNKSTYTINGHKIDLKHMAASLAGILYDSPALTHILYEELEYDCVVSWAGDLHTLMEDSILKSGVKEEYGSYLNATYNLMGKSSTSFSMEDVYADLDAWILYYNMKENSNLSIGEIFDKYYSGKSSRSYKNRYTSFINIMNTIATQFKTSKINFEGVVAHFTNTDKSWQTIDSLEITPTDAEQQEIADGFIKWIKEQASKE